EVIRRRLAPLPAPCRDALTFASVVGREFGLGALQRACGLGADALLEVLRPALGRDILVPDPRTAGRYRFVHALIRETIYGAQGKAGDGPAARETFRQAADIARRIGDAALLARSALGFAGEGSRLLWVRSGVVDQPRIELLEEALHRLGDGDPGLRARLLARLAINLYWDPQ